ncbi:crotonase/enoyl-CoA hydratase family protein [Nocardioides insulae]|uniref:crotonase/enoyl-CoA hydratase family protein n=1 Tax=Nocardioides insulae TaxID=394734 RepID=UPI00041F1FED|nr:crotonase/enoyl-CoA hydratase family protein [Nocardioides insulae]
MTSTDRVSIEVADGVAQVRLTRPDKMNALDPAMFNAIVEAGLEVRDRDDVRAVVLSGEGRAFCAGLDFGQFQAMADGSRTGATDVTLPVEPIGAAEARGQQAVHVWSQVQAPVIAAVHGVAFGGGLQVALGADIRIAHPETKMSVMEVQWGLVPDMCGTQLLPELIGRDRAKELALTGRVFTGAEAAELGVVTRTAEDPIAEATALATQIADHSGSSTRAIKRLIDLAGHVSLAEGFRAEQKEIRALIGSDEQKAVVARRMSSGGKAR